jgi:hypothetical protein
MKSLYNTERIERALKVLERVESFVKEYEVTCEESIYQMDRTLIASPDLVSDLCALAGFAEMDDFGGVLALPESGVEPDSNGHYIGLDR